MIFIRIGIAFALSLGADGRSLLTMTTSVVVLDLETIVAGKSFGASSLQCILELEIGKTRHFSAVEVEC
jgi:hypothetical protein